MTPSPTELTTAATDAILALVCVAGHVLLERLQGVDVWKKRVWASVFALLALGSAIGAFFHAVELAPWWELALRRSLFPILGLSVAMFVIGAIADWRGRDQARAALPWAVAAGVGALALPFLSSLGFRLFVAFEAVGMVTALIIYVALWRRQKPGAGTVAAGIVLTLLAAVIQSTSLSVTIIWPFDHNGLFHLVQIVALFVTAAGVRRTLRLSGRIS